MSIKARHPPTDRCLFTDETWVELSSAGDPIQAAPNKMSDNSAHCGTAPQWQLTGDLNASAHGNAARVPQENTSPQ